MLYRVRMGAKIRARGGEVRRAATRTTRAPAPASTQARARRAELKCGADAQSSATSCWLRSHCSSPTRTARRPPQTSPRSAYGRSRRYHPWLRRVARRREPRIFQHRIQGSAQSCHTPPRPAAGAGWSVSPGAPAPAVGARARPLCAPEAMSSPARHPPQRSPRSSPNRAGTACAQMVSPRPRSWTHRLRLLRRLRHLVMHVQFLYNPPE